MKKTILLGFIMSAQFALAQPEMVVNKRWMSSYYSNFSKDVYSINEIPPYVVDSAKSILARYMGNDLSKRLIFSMAQVIDTSKYLKSEKKKMVPLELPKYEFAFELQIPEIGFEDLTIELRLSQQGTPLKLTWPRQGVKDVSVFLPLDTIRAFALRKAKELNFQLENYKVDFLYDETAQKFLWQFKFPNGKIDEDGSGKYHLVSINWLDTNEFVVKDITKSIVY